MPRKQLFGYCLGNLKRKCLSVFQRDSIFPDIFNLQQVDHVDVDQEDAEIWLYAMKLTM